jgi:hypothetical protein
LRLAASLAGGAGNASSCAIVAGTAESAIDCAAESVAIFTGHR